MEVEKFSRNPDEIGNKKEKRKGTSGKKKIKEIHRKSGGIERKAEIRHGDNMDLEK